MCAKVLWKSNLSIAPGLEQLVRDLLRVLESLGLGGEPSQSTLPI